MEEKIFNFIFIFAFISVGYLIFFYVPVSLYTEARCLKSGYPESRVSIGLERYCMTLDGVVTVKVDKQGK